MKGEREGEWDIIHATDYDQHSTPTTHTAG